MVGIAYISARANALEAAEGVLADGVHAARIGQTLVHIHTTGSVRVAGGAWRARAMKAAREIGAQGPGGAQIGRAFVDVGALKCRHFCLKIHSILK